MSKKRTDLKWTGTNSKTLKSTIKSTWFQQRIDFPIYSNHFQFSILSKGSKVYDMLGVGTANAKLGRYHFGSGGCENVFGFHTYYQSDAYCFNGKTQNLLSIRGPLWKKDDILKFEINRIKGTLKLSKNGGELHTENNVDFGKKGDPLYILASVYPESGCKPILEFIELVEFEKGGGKEKVHNNEEVKKFKKGNIKLKEITRELEKKNLLLVRDLESQRKNWLNRENQLKLEVESSKNKIRDLMKKLEEEKKSSKVKIRNLMKQLEEEKKKEELKGNDNQNETLKEFLERIKYPRLLEKFKKENFMMEELEFFEHEDELKEYLPNKIQRRRLFREIRKKFSKGGDDDDDVELVC